MTLRVLCGLFLALVLSLTSVTMAVARGQMTGAMTLELCDGHGGTATVTLDADGNPVDSTQHCPDCLIATPAPAGDPVMAPARPLTRSEPHVCALPLDADQPAAPEPAARGPPPLL